MLTQDSVHKDNIAELKGYKHNLRKSLTDAKDAMSPVLAQDFLCHPLDEAEAKVLGWIRHHYLTEAVLGYNSVLYFAGHSLSRSHLVECMSLAQIVAQTPSLTQVFVDSGKMRELVRSFALDSQSLLLANEQPKKTGLKKEKGLEIWQIDWKKQELNLEDLD
jgi:Nuclear pore protein 84 / 107